MENSKDMVIPVDHISLNTHTPGSNNFEFTIDCGAVYFGAVYDNDGRLAHIDQYFFTDNASRWDLASAVSHGDEVVIDEQDFPVSTHLITKKENGEEWLRFHAIVPDIIDTAYFARKYINEAQYAGVGNEV